MRDKDKRKDQLLIELQEMRRRVAELESALDRENRPGTVRRSAKKRKSARLSTSVDLLGQKKGTKEFIQNVLANIIESIVVTNLEGRLIYFNEFSEEMFGYQADEVLNSHIVILGAREPDVLGHIRRNEPYRGEIILRTKDGRRFPSHVRCVPLTDEADQPVGMVGVARDLTREKEKERVDQEMERLQSFNENLIASLNDGIQIIDSSGIITFANKRLEDMVEYARGQLIGVHFTEIVAGDVLPVFQRLVETGGTFIGKSSLETRLVSRSGRRIPVLVSVSPFVGDGTTAGTVAAITDLSEVAMLKEELCQSEKMSLVGTLASEVAHEINNPLGGLIMAVQMLIESLEKGEFDRSMFLEELNDINSDARRCRRIVRKLLEFSRRWPEGKIPLNLNEVTEEAMLLVQRQAELDNVTFVKSYAAVLPLVRGNPNDLQQVIINLIKNARDAMPEGGQIDVSTEEIVLNGRLWAGLSIGDTGTGIPGELKSRIFESFFSTKDYDKGTGLGLAVSMRIVKEHGGDISFSNRDEGGAVFRIVLPSDQNLGG